MHVTGGLEGYTFIIQNSFHLMVLFKICLQLLEMYGILTQQNVLPGTLDMSDL